MKQQEASCIEGFLPAVERHGGVLLACIVALYAFFASQVARGKLIWDDEFFTLYLATSPGWSGIRDALLTGADQHPPLFYWIHQQVIAALGAGHVTLRLPELIAGAVMIVALYYFVRRRTSPLFGISAALLALLTLILPYTYEARGYALVAGTFSLALLCWQIALERRSRIALIGLWAALFIAVSSHYYALVLIVPLAIGQLIECARSRRWRLPVWLALTGAVAPVLLFFPFITAARSYAGTFWAKAAWGLGVDYYAGVFGGILPGLIAFGVLLAIYRLLRGFWPMWGIEQSERFKPHEIAAITTLALTPLLVLALAKTVTIGFYPRYIIAGALGVSLLIIMVIHAGVRGNRTAGALLAAALLLCFCAKGNLEMRGARGTTGTVAQTYHFLDAVSYPELPIVVSEITEFHRLSFYASGAVADRLVYLSDPEESLTYLGHDTVDKGFLALRPWFPLRLPVYRDYIQAHDRFLMYGYIGDWTWLSFALVREGFDLKLIGRNGIRLLFLVSRNASTTEPGQRTDYLEPQSHFPLRLRIEAANPAHSLCQRWTGDRACDTFLYGETYGYQDELAGTSLPSPRPLG